MTKYDDLFETTAATDSVFAEKRALDPLTESDEIRGRESQERKLATILAGVHEGYLPPTVTIHGPPGTGKTATTRRVCREFADRHEQIAVEYVNLKECRTIFSAANEIHLELTGETVGAYEGLDGAFTGIWEELETYPDWTVLILDEIDHIAQDTNYDPSDFLYRLLRGEGKLSRGIQLSAWLISNELLEVDLRLDSRVESAMSDETVFFPPYGISELTTVVESRLDRAFQAGTLPDEVRAYGIREAARRWGDARKTLRLFRRAGETATERELDQVTIDCLEANLEETDKETTIEKLLKLPFNHFLVLTGVTGWENQPSGEIKQPVTTNEIVEYIQDSRLHEDFQLSERAVRDLLTDLETMGLVETWIDSRGRDGRIKQSKTTFEPQWVKKAIPPYIRQSDQITADELLAEKGDKT